MTHDDLNAFETRLTGLIKDTRQEMRALNDETRQEMRALNEETRQEMRALNEETREEMHALNDETRQEMRALNEETRHEMRLLHEETLDRIAALAPDLRPIERSYIAADNALREEINQRLEPIEHWIRTRRPRKS